MLMDAESAIGREKQIKGGKRRKKEGLIEGMYHGKIRYNDNRPYYINLVV
jgi:predicted GIY-YIG superfamily endonuclease